MDGRRTSRSDIRAFMFPEKVEDLPPVEYTVPNGVVEEEFQQWRTSSRMGSVLSTDHGESRNNSRAAAPSTSAKTTSVIQRREKLAMTRPVPKTRNTKKTSNARPTKETKRAGESTDIKVLFKSIRILILYFQVIFLSFFAFNNDICFKVVFTLFASLFETLNVLLNTPCFFNCFINIRQLKNDGFTVELLQVIIQYVVLLHVLCIAFFFLTNGGRINRLLTSMEDIGEQLRIKINSNIITSIYQRLVLVVVAFIGNAFLQCYLQYSLNERSIMRKYQPDRVKEYFSKEGLGKYIYEYQPIVFFNDNVTFWMTMFARLITFIQIRSVEVLSFHLRHVVSKSLFPLIDLVQERSRMLIDVKEGTRSASTMKKELLHSCHAIDKVSGQLTFISLLFNSVSGLLSLAILVTQSSFVFLIPHSNLLEVYQILLSLTCIVITVNSGTAVCRSLNEARKFLFENQEDCSSRSDKSRVLTKTQQIMLLTAAGMVVIFLLLTCARVHDVKVWSLYDVNQTRDWTLDVTNTFPSEAKKKIRYSIVGDEGYPHPSTFMDKNWQMFHQPCLGNSIYKLKRHKRTTLRQSP